MEQPEICADWKAIPACVPGNVELDLIHEGFLPENLEQGNNIYALRSLETFQWWFSRTFTVESLRAERTDLVLEGVDTLASVWLNGTRIGTLENMMIPHRLDVTGLLRKGENSLVIGIDSPVLAAQEYPVEAGEWAMENNWESLHIRKAAHTFGWDIMPRAISAGLWKDVYLEMVPDCRFRDVYIATLSADAAKRSAKIWVKLDVATQQWPLDQWTVRLSVAPSNGGAVVFEKQIPLLCAHSCQKIQLENIDLWWPRGYGDSPLYDVKLELLDADECVRAERRERCGFRTVQLDITECTDSQGSGEFAFIVNGEKIFIKGTNWVPLDAFHSRDPQHLDATLDMVCDLNCNMVRCWGGNVYEGQAFFNRCDEEGLLVWQDFAFGCALYPQTAEFHQKVRKEAEAIVPLLRNHPSLALWAGNNECDLFYTFERPGCDPNVDDKISRVVLPSVCSRLDPWRDYLPSSPYFGPELMAKGAPHDMRTEDHLWGPRDDFKGKFYSTSNVHFVSEIGYHGCPSRVSMEKMMTPENLWPWQGNDEWYTHAVRPQPNSTEYNYRIPLMANQIGVLFGEMPDNLDDFIFASQFSQAEANKYFIEHFRINKGRRNGILWWNVRDGWPQISDAIVDYYGERKLAYAVTKRIQQDVCVMLNEPVNGNHPVIAVNDTMAETEITVRILCGSRLLLEKTARLPQNGKAALGTVPCSDTAAFYRLVWVVNDREFQNHYAAGPRPFDLHKCREFYAAEGLFYRSEKLQRKRTSKAARAGSVTK
jgi:beta-mannosidase